MIYSKWFAPLQKAPEFESLQNTFSQADTDKDTLHAWRLVLMQEKNPLAIGCLSYFNSEIGKLDHVFVHEQRRGEGLGDAVVRMLILKAESLGLKQIIAVCSSGTAPFFSLLDFSEQNKDTNTDMVVMRRELGIGFRCHCAD